MGFLNKLLKAVAEEPENKKIFAPDFNDSEYNNWLKFLDCGGTSDEWEILKKESCWKFREDPFSKYQEEIKEVSDHYYDLMQKINEAWKVLNKTKDYNSDFAEMIEEWCLLDILYYKQIRIIDIKYNKTTATNVPAFTRLAMLYEKQGRIQEAISICEEALDYDIDENKRLERLKKKF